MKLKPSIKDVVDNKFCTGCGACISEAPNSSAVMEMNEDGFLVPTSVNQLDANLAIKVCPFNPVPEEEVKNEDNLASFFLNETTNYSGRIGKYNHTYVGYSPKYRLSSSSGGIATFIFHYLLTAGIVDYLFIVKEENGSYKYGLHNRNTEIKQISKTRYYPVTLEDLFVKISHIPGKVAVSGVACFIKAVRLKQYYNPELRAKIPFLVGIICGGLKSKFFTDYLAQKSGILNKYHRQEYRIKDKSSRATDYSFGAYDMKDNFFQIKMKKVGDMWGTGMFKSKACDFCSDVTTELADISLGDAWLDEYKEDGLGNSIIVTRSLLADRLIKDGISSHELVLKVIDKKEIIKSQSSSFTHRQDALKFRYSIYNLLHTALPIQRDRIVKRIPWHYKFVQLQRMVTRNMSLKLWRKYRQSEVFERRIKKYLIALKIFTLINHRLR